MERIFIGIKLKADVASRVSQLYRRTIQQTVTATTPPDQEHDVTTSTSTVVDITTTKKLKGVNWVDENNLHLTLKFVGEVTVEQRQVIQTGLSTVTTACPSFSMKLGKVTSSPKRGPIRSIHVNVTDPSLTDDNKQIKQLQLLKKTIDDTLQPILTATNAADDQQAKDANSNEDEVFRGHITIGRVGYANIKQLMEWIMKNKNYNGPEMVVDSVQLFRSSESQYHVLAEYPLQGVIPTTVTIEKSTTITTEDDASPSASIPIMNVSQNQSDELKRKTKEGKTDAKIKTNSAKDATTSEKAAGSSKDSLTSRPVMERIFIGIKLKPIVASTVSGQLFREEQLNQMEQVQESSIDGEHGASTTVISDSNITSTIATTARMKGVKWIEDRNLHITLRFIGEVTVDHRKEIENCLSTVDFESFEMKLSKVSNFPRKGPVRIIHVGVDRGDLAVRMLKKKIDESLENQEGYKKESADDFTTHITIARVSYANNAEVKSWINEHSEYDGPEMNVESFQLFKSTFTSNGAEYEVLADYPLN